MKTIAIMILAVGLLLSSCAKNKTSQSNEQTPIVEKSDSTIYIKGENFEGVIFKPTYKWNRLGEGVKEVEYSILLALPEHKDVKPWSSPKFCVKTELVRLPV